jgi:hypothetical protein
MGEGVQRAKNFIKDRASNAVETGQDFATKVGVTLGIKDRPPCEIKGAPANPTADIDYSDLPKDVEASARIQADAAAQHICNLEADIAKLQSEGKGAEAAELSKELTEAKEALSEFKYQIETSGAELGRMLLLGPLGVFFDQHADMDEVNAASDQLKFDIPDVNSTEDLAPSGEAKAEETSEAKGDKKVGLGKWREKRAERAEKREARQNAGGVDSTDGAKTDEKLANDQGKSLLAEGGGAIRDAMKSDPEGFAKMLTDMDPSLAGAMMNEMQNHMQAINRAWSSISNMEKAEHDTQKAIISNLRV